MTQLPDWDEIVAFQKEGEPSQADRIYRGALIYQTIMFLRKQIAGASPCNLSLLREQAEQAKSPGEKAFLDVMIAGILIQHHLRGRLPADLNELHAIRRTLYL